MTESEWLGCEDPTTMLEFLQGKVSDRKLRLFTCKCCRNIWPTMPDEASRRVVEVAERFADRLMSDKQRRVSRNAPGIRGIARLAAARNGQMIQAARTCAGKTPFDLASAAGRSILFENEGYWAVVAAEKIAQCNVIHDIFGNPFRPISINPVWLTPTVIGLAQAAYDERIMPSGGLEPARLGVLSDALEEAGCDDADILNHLRSPGPHMRGCWALDLLLGKE